MPPDPQATYTLPLALMVVLLLLGVAALAWLYSRRRQLQGAVEAEFKAFREKAVALMDRLDALRQRHRSLPLTDPDFTAPMSGATLALYNAVEADLNVLWERWLKVMELWDQAQKLVRSGSGLAVREAEKARRLLDQGNIDELLRQSASCKERLDRLNQGHEQARAALKAGQDELARLRESLDRGSEISVRSGTYHDEVAGVATLMDQAERMLASDPIGAEEVIARSRRALTGLTDRRDQEPERPRAPRPSYSLLEDLAAAGDGFRTAAAQLRLTNLLGLFARVWMVVWAFALLIGLLGPLMPLIVLVLGFVLILAGFGAIWQIVTFWFWYGMWRVRR
jgi:hypothetical protein